MSMEKRGPVAPKDPTAKRQGFYIMRNKSISASPQSDGRSICFIYEDSGRLQSSAKLVGNITDENILGMMGKVDTLRKLVHSIGVSIDTQRADEEAVFAFQMYGHKDPYVSGTTISISIPTDGMEYVIDLNEIEWSLDDNGPGQIRFEFPRTDVFATVSVILYLNDGYEAPPLTEEEPMDCSSDEYKNIIAKSLLNKGNNFRIKKAIEKARRGEDVTIAFIGGSITQGAGAVPINTACYSYLTYRGFLDVVNRKENTSPEELPNVHYIKAGVGGTPSELGMLRYDTDVTNDGQVSPDIVIVEFAVNDEGDETKGKCYDSLVRKIYNSPQKPAVVLEFAVFANDWNLEERLCIVGEKYDLPMASARSSVVEQFYKTKEEGKVITKNQFFYDLFHPTNAGHKIMADGIINLIKIADEAALDEDKDISNIEAPIGSEFENIILVDRKHMPLDAKVSEGSFTSTDNDIQYVERNLDLTASPEFAYNWMHDGKQKAKAITLEVTAKDLIVIYKDSSSPLVGLAEVFVDGELMECLDPHLVGWTHCNPKIVYTSKEAKKHILEVRIKEGYEDKSFTVLGFGITV